MNQVFVLFNGYSYFENHQDPPIMKANSSCVLIKGKNDCNVIIDTMTAWDADLLLSGNFWKKLDFIRILSGCETIVIQNFPRL